uniref:Uncharacterized protein n=1 Tax=Rhizophora mucronata TaxID=61149 RepID=A0A2P2MXG8_RHIMU
MSHSEIELHLNVQLDSFVALLVLLQQFSKLNIISVIFHNFMNYCSSISFCFLFILVMVALTNIFHGLFVDDIVLIDDTREGFDSKLEFGEIT